MNNRILIVDDHPAVRMSVQMLLASEGFNVIQHTDNGADALRLVDEFRPSTMILDLGIPVIDGLTVVSEVLAKNIPIKIVVLTGLSPDHMAARCKQIGVHGFVSKQSELIELIHAVMAVRAGQEYFPDLTCSSIDSADVSSERELLQRLSIREFRVMQQLVGGMSNKEIADASSLSTKTISTYKVRLLNKLNIGSIVELYAFARRNGLA